MEQATIHEAPYELRRPRVEGNQKKQQPKKGEAEADGPSNPNPLPTTPTQAGCTQSPLGLTNLPLGLGNFMYLATVSLCLEWA